jgi:hypothetical protein
MRSINLALLSFLLGGACGGAKAMTTQTPTATPITTHDEARAALGKMVQIRGTVQREKLGDTINVGDLSVRCTDFQFPDASVGSSVTAEGTLEPRGRGCRLGVRDP